MSDPDFNAKCTCTYVASGHPMKNNACPVHTEEMYKCDECACSDYRPATPADPEKSAWPNCVCGHCAQAHN